MSLTDEDKAFLRGLLSRPLPAVLTPRMAAQALSVGLTTLRAMMDSGAIRTCDIGGRRMVPISEVERLSRPSHPAAPTRAKPNSPRDYDAKEEARKVRAMLREKS